MKIGEIYDMAKGYLPHVTPALLTHFYNMGLDKISSDVRISVLTETYDTTTYPSMPLNAVKIMSVEVDGELSSRLIGGQYV